MKKSIRLLLMALVFVFAIVSPVFAKDLPTQYNVPLDKEWKITFNENVLGINALGGDIADYITLYRTDVTPYTAVNVIYGHHMSEPNSVWIMHDKLFAAGASYKLSVSPNAVSKSGTKISDGVNLCFSTQGQGYSSQIADLRAQEIVVSPGYVLTLNGRIHNLTVELQIHKLRYESESTFKSMMQSLMLQDTGTLTLKARQMNNIATQAMNGYITDDNAIAQLQALSLT